MGLKPCPFCGGADISIGDFGVMCNGCGVNVSGPGTRDRSAWNRRAPAWQPIETAPKVEGKTDDDVIDLWVAPDPERYPGATGRRVPGAWWAPEDPTRYDPDDRPAGWWGPHERYGEEGPIETDGERATHWTPAPKPPET